MTTTTEATGPNHDLFVRVLAQIEKHPETWNQQTYGHECETGRCFAGWTVTLEGGQYIDRNLVAVPEDAGFPTYRELYSYAHDATPGLTTVWDRAIRLLGVTHDQVFEDTHLFNSLNSLDDLYRISASICGLDGVARQGAGRGRSRMTTDLHPTKIPALVESIEAKIRADAVKVIDDRAETLLWMASEVLLGHPFLASTHLDMIRPLVDEELTDDDVGLLFAALCQDVRSAQVTNSQANGDDTGIQKLIDRRVAGLLGLDTFITCVYCDGIEDRDAAEFCDGKDFCSRDCHRDFEVPSMCPEDRL